MVFKYFVKTLRQPNNCIALLIVRTEATNCKSNLSFVRVMNEFTNKALFMAGVPNLGSADPFGSVVWLLWIRGRIPKKINILALTKKILIIFKLIFYNSLKK